MYNLPKRKLLVFLILSISFLVVRKISLKNQTRSVQFLDSSAQIVHTRNLTADRISRTFTDPQSEFSGKRSRQFSENKRKFKFTTRQSPSTGSSEIFDGDKTVLFSTSGGHERSCNRWAVVTTIREHSESVRRMLYIINKPRSDWCMVIVGDLNKPSTYEFVSTLANHKNVVFLNSEEQEKIIHDSEHLSTFGSLFVDSLPWYSYGRKNVGYAYALTQRPTPKFIWDFDDNNQLKFWVDNASLKKLYSLDNLVSLLSSSNSIQVFSINESSYRHTLQTSSKNIVDAQTNLMEGKGQPDVPFNPYTALGCGWTKCWPRGFPLSYVNEEHFNAAYQSLNSWLSSPKDVQADSISIVQSVADHKPDVDAKFRQNVNGQPFSFRRRDKDVKKINKLLVIPNGLVVPMNAQASLHSRSAFFSLYLPWTVNARVADIWRSYIAQAVLSLTGHSVAFAPLPLVDQDRNTDRGPMADFEAESQLYLQVDSLIQRLYEWKKRQENNYQISQESHKLSPNIYFIQNLAALVEDLYIDLYEREFVEVGDVISVQYWLHHLTCYGHVHSEKPLDCHNPSWNVGIQPVISPDKLQLFQEIGNHQEDYTVSICPDINRKYPKTDHNRLPKSNDVSGLTFLSVDLHNASRTDIPTLLASIGYRTIIASRKGALTYYPKVLFGKYSTSKQTLIEESPLKSNVIERYNDYNTPLNDSDIPENFYYYTHEGKDLLDQTDVFLSSFPPALFQIWNSFLLPDHQMRKRSVILAAVHRYNIGRCSLKEWRKLNKDIKLLLSSSSVHHIVGAMSRYDVEYLHHYTGIKKDTNGYTRYNDDVNPDRRGRNVLRFLPAMSAFYTRPKVEHKLSNLQKPKTLLTFVRNPKAAYETLRLSFEKLYKRNIHMVGVWQDLKRFELSDLQQYGAVLYYPYSVMSYKFVELYSLNIPLMVPSMKYFRDNTPFGNDRSIITKTYCKKRSLGLEMAKSSNSVHQYNPNIISDTPFHNNENKQHELYWLQFSDFYDYPHVTYFDNASHAADLFAELATKDQGEYFLNIRRLMEEENKMRRYFAIEKTWCPLLDDISRSIHGSG